jgi:hypothetical protein
MKTLDDVRIAEVVKQDIQIEVGKILAYRTRLKISFKYHSKDVPELDWQFEISNKFNNQERIINLFTLFKR